MRTQYGVRDVVNGTVLICSSRAKAETAIEREPLRYALMKRHVSEWEQVQ